MHSSKGRRIVVDGVEWFWRVGRGHVVARGPDNQKLCEHAGTIKGIHPDDFHRGQHKKTSDGSVTPSEVEQWIRASAL